MSKDTRMGVHKGTVVSFVPTLFGYFLGIPSLCLSIFKNIFVTMDSPSSEKTMVEAINTLNKKQHTYLHICHFIH